MYFTCNQTGFGASYLLVRDPILRIKARARVLCNMSVRSNNVRYNSSLNSSSTTSIDFKEEFSNSAAALAASHDDTVSHILSRLDQLQSKFSNLQSKISLYNETRI